MRPELETYQQIDQYLNGLLSGEELHAFEQKCATDASFAEEVDLFRITNQVVLGANFDDVRQQMTKDISSIDSKNKLTKKWLLGLAIGVVGVSIIGTVLTVKNESPVSVENSLTKDSSVSTTNPVKNTSQDTSIEQTTVGLEKSSPSKNKSVPIDSQQTSSSISVAEPKESNIVQSKSTLEVQKVAVVEPNESKEKSVLENPCKEISLSATITSKPSCTNNQTGSIHIPITSIHGGKQPYSIQFESNKPSQKETYNYLATGSYTLLIRDANNCFNTFTQEVVEVNCRKTSYVFAPDKGQTWTLDALNDQEFSIRLLNVSGKEVYKSEHIQNTFEWNGLSQQGAYLDAGLYIYILETVSGEKENGQVTIVR